MTLQPSAVKVAALDLGIPVLQPEKASDPVFIQELAALEPQAIVVVAYGQILRPAVLDLPPLGCVNLHGSILPKLRGAAPIQWAVIHGFRETGVTTIQMDPGMDSGPILLTEQTEILAGETAGELAIRLAPIGARLLCRSIASLETGALQPQPQDPTLATFAPMLRRGDGAIRWSEPAPQIVQRILGCNPSPGAYALRERDPVKLWRARVAPGLADLAPGTVASLDPLTIASGSEWIILDEVQPASRARVSGSAFARGWRARVGERWHDGE
jgi:methionyl-tRNA formyltransferase